MIILGFETSCDETSVALISGSNKKQNVDLITNLVSSSVFLHSKTGGIIPEIAAREQVKYIIPLLKRALNENNLNKENIDAIAVTVGPGLIGSLLVGVETAKTIAYVWDKPIVPVNHLYGHIYANWINDGVKKDILFPAIALIVSGGHTDLVLMKNHRDLKWLGGTRDDAAGEALDKIGRLLNLEYPAGAQIERLAKNVLLDKYKFPRPLLDSGDFDFSFSGLKTAVLREIEKNKNATKDLKNICYSTQKAIFDVIIKKTLQACKKYDAKSLFLGGGVAANQKLRDEFTLIIENNKLKINFFVPTKSLCTDNAAMICSAAFYNYENASWKNVEANPDAYFD